MREVTRVKYQQYELPDYLFFASAKAKKQKTGTERFDPSLAVAGKEAFTSSTSPASGINKKTIILDSNGCIDLTFSERIAFAKKLIQLGFEVYLCSQNEPFGFTKLTEDLANYKILDQLTKFNSKGGYQKLAESFQLARDKVKVLNPVDLYEVRTSFTQLFKDASNPYLSADALKVNFIVTISKLEEKVNENLYNIFDDANPDEERLGYINNIVDDCLKEVDGFKLLRKKVKIYKDKCDDQKRGEEIQQLILETIDTKKREFCDKTISELMCYESIGYNDVYANFRQLYEFDLSRFKEFLFHCFKHNKFLQQSLHAVSLNSNIRFTFFECLIERYPDVRDLPEIFYEVAKNKNNLKSLKTFNYEYAKNFSRIINKDSDNEHLSEFPEDQDYIIEKLRDEYNSLTGEEEKSNFKTQLLHNFPFIHANEFFLKLQEFIDEQYCRVLLNPADPEGMDQNLCKVIIKVWPNLIDEISLKGFAAQNNFKKFQFVSTVFEVRPDLVATILKDEYWLNIKFEAASYLDFLKSAFKSDPEATREFIKARMARRNIPITPLIAAILPEEAESILEKLTGYISTLERDAFDIFEYSSLKQSYQKSLGFGSLDQLSSNRRVLNVYRNELETADISTRKPTSICLDYDKFSSIQIQDLELLPKSFSSEVVTLELSNKADLNSRFNSPFNSPLDDIGQLKKIFPNLKHISISMSLDQKVEEFEKLRGACSEFDITIDVDQLSLAKSQYDKNLVKKSDGEAEVKYQQNTPKPGEIFLGNAKEQYQLDSSNEKQSFQMQLSGKVLNNDFRGNPQIISSVKTMKISDQIDFEVVSANEFQPIFIPNVTPAKIVEFARSQSSSKLYASLNISLTVGETKFLPCLSSYDEFEGIIGDVPEGVSILKGNDGFYYAESDRDIDFNYIVSSDQTRQAALSNGVAKAKNIIEKFQHKTDVYKEVAEIPKNAEGIKAWLNNAYDEKLGACRHRVAAVYHKLIEAGIEKVDIRAYGINRNHVIIAVKEGANWVSYDLGGQESELTFRRENPSKSTRIFGQDLAEEEITSYTKQETKYSSLQELKNDVKAKAKKGSSLDESTKKDLFAKVDESLDLCKGQVFGSFRGRKTFLNSNTFKSLKQLDEEQAKDTSRKFNKQFELSNHQDGFNQEKPPELYEDKQSEISQTKQALLLSSRPQPRESLTEAQVLNRKLLKDFQTKFSFQRLEQDVFEGLLTNEASKILIATDRIDEHANYLMAQYGDKVFYIDNPDQLDFTRSRLQIADEGFVSLTQESDLARFLRSPEHGNGALLINWSAFSNQQKVALNTLLDREATIAGIKLSEGLKIISLDKARSEDPSFASRHNVSYKSSLNPQVRDHDRDDGMPEHKAFASKSSQAEITQIDLMGLSDWRQALFGKMSLAGEAIIWHKSYFVDVLRAGASNFEIANLSEQAIKELNYEVRQAKAKGYFDYHGYRIKLPEGFDVKVTTKNFDFSKFNAISVRKNCQYKQEEGAEIINTHIFDQLLHKHQIKDGQYIEIPGLLEANSTGSLRLFITSDLTEAQYYCMLNEAGKYHVNLELLLAPNVSLPTKIKTNEHALLEAAAVRASALSEKAKIIVTNDIGSYDMQRDEQVIDIEDFGYEALISSITYKVSQEGFSEFDQNISKFREGLQKGEKFVLRGEFTDAMLNILAPLIAEAGENLTIVIEDKDLRAGVASYPRLDWLSDRLKFRYKELEAKQEITKRTEIEDKSFDLADSEAKAARFIETRKGLVLDALTGSNMVLLEGHSGVGKSSLMKEFEEHHQSEISVHRELTSFTQWAEDKSEGKTKILFIDESNIEDKHFTLFNGLKSVGAKSIFYNGKFYDLTENHKVVFACNPIEYGGGRFEQKLFNQGDIPIIEFRDFPASYIYENILKRAIYCERMSSRLDESRFKEICAPLIEQYKKQQEVSGDTVRELQEQVLRELLQEFQVAPASDLRGANFITTSATKKVEQELYEAINIRAKQRSGVFNGVASGLNGVLLEGGAGVGKSEMIKEMLRANNIRPKGDLGGHCYYKIEADMPLAEKRRLIVQAFEEGNIVWIDEINSCLDDGLEKLLNSVLTGIHPDTGARSAKAGFMLLASCNSAGLEGRSIISPALRHRMSTPKLTELVDYEIEDLTQIIQHWYRHDGIDVAKAQQLAESFKEMISNPEYTEYNLRMFRDVLISEYNLTGQIHYQARDGEIGDKYQKTSIYEVSGGNLGDGFVGKVRAEQGTINDKIVQSLKSALAETASGDLKKQQIKPEEFMSIVIEFAQSNNGVGNAPKEAVNDFCREYGSGIYELAKSFSVCYQKHARVNGLYTGREDGDNGALLRRDKEVGARLKRIPKELVEDVIKQALNPLTLER